MTALGTEFLHLRPFTLIAPCSKYFRKWNLQILSPWFFVFYLFSFLAPYPRLPYLSPFFVVSSLSFRPAPSFLLFSGLGPHHFRPSRLALLHCRCSPLWLQLPQSLPRVKNSAHGITFRIKSKKRPFGRRILGDSTGEFFPTELQRKLTVIYGWGGGLRQGCLDQSDMQMKTVCFP